MVPAYTEASYGHHGTFQYYNGQPHAEVAKSLDNGIHRWNDRGGIVGRGVLLDYVRYAERKGVKYEVMSKHIISVAALEEMIADEGLELRAGDILLVRSGFTNWYENADEVRNALTLAFATLDN